MSLLEDSHGLDWLQPGKKEVSVVGKYVAEEAPRLHAGFGGSSQLDIEQVKFVTDSQPYQRLESALKTYITETLRIQVTTFDENLCDRIGEMEKTYRESKNGFWHRFWYGCGDVRDMNEVWLDLIPDEYGLSVLKAGIALVLKFAENSKDKRDKILKTFTTLQEALICLHPHRARFRSNPDAIRSAESLYKAIVKAIEDMVVMLAYLEMPLSTKLTYKLKLRRDTKPAEARLRLDGILEALEMNIKDYDEAMSLARDRAQEQTEVYSRVSAVGIGLVHENTAYLRRLADYEATDRRRQHQEEAIRNAEMLNAIRRGETSVQLLVEQQTDLRTLLMRVIMDHEKDEAIKTIAQRQVVRTSRHTAVVSFIRLCGILAQPLSARNGRGTPNLRSAFQHPSADLGHALAEQGRFSARTQGQVNSLLEHSQFLDWLSRSHPSLILVDANIRELALEHLSAISVFSSTLVTSLMEAYPETAVVLHFFCGLHASPIDPWFLQNLEQHSLIDLCQALHKLLYEFTPDTYVYFIIDSISSFDARRLSNDLSIVMQGLQNIVNDPKLVPVAKVFITNPFESTRAIQDMLLLKENPSQLISLSRDNLVPGSISSRVVDDHLLRAPSPLRGRTPSPVGYNRAPSPVMSARKRITGPAPGARDTYCDANVDDDEIIGWNQYSDDIP
ncbi:hypothetical protein F4777DRAFT_595865 [Nemania sp. FL0916]|nr:hypothetical protein F4777DRAFT_595865 [Nemania sp. FL0916]